MKYIPKKDRLKTALVATAGTLLSTSRSPDEALGQLFSDVQNRQVYDDGKTFVDLIPRRRMRQIQQEYLLAREDPNFDLHEFVARHFYEFSAYKSTYKSDGDASARDHINELWHVLERKNRRDRGSLVAVPHPYIVPGGRFSEQFYWDTYFIMLGLAADNRWDKIEGMVKNYGYMIRKFGFIPTANRTYFLSRSQPPFFSHMVRLLARHRGRTRTYSENLPYMLSEYRFWMRGKRALNDSEHARANTRVVRMPNGVTLNRYFDNKSTPRPESLREDEETAEGIEDDRRRKLYLDLRAGAESGWDFSSRWFKDPHDIRTIHTTDLVPVDLNCLLYDLETLIAETYRTLKQPLLARRFQQLAERRARTILQYCWDDDNKFFGDYDFTTAETTGRDTLAALYPLYVGIATTQQATAVAEKIEHEFLREGGLITTLIENGQQWDAPNGWAPLHWVAIKGLRRYGFYQLADTIKHRWMETNMKVYNAKSKMIEKYDVESHTGIGGGGEYPLQDGFGWTNGVLAALLNEDEAA